MAFNYKTNDIVDDDEDVNELEWDDIKKWTKMLKKREIKATVEFLKWKFIPPTSQ